MRKDLQRDDKTRPKKPVIPAWPFIVAILIFGFLVRDNIKELFPGLKKEDVKKARLKEDMEIRHPITKLYFETYKFDGAEEFFNEFWKKCEDDLNNTFKAVRCSDLVKNLIDREGATPKIAMAITDHYCFERTFAPFCNRVYEHWKRDDEYSLRILERSCKELKDKRGCELSHKIIE